MKKSPASAEQALLDSRVAQLSKVWDGSSRLDDVAMLRLYWIFHSVSNGMPMPALATAAIAKLTEMGFTAHFEQNYCSIPT